jgi:thioredoxin-related protein
MKKIIVVFFLVSIFLFSCKSKEKCPAYSKTVSKEVRKV